MWDRTGDGASAIRVIVFLLCFITAIATTSSSSCAFLQMMSLSGFDRVVVLPFSGCGSVYHSQCLVLTVYDTDSCPSFHCIQWSPVLGESFHDDVPGAKKYKKSMVYGWHFGE